MSSPMALRALLLTHALLALAACSKDPTPSDSPAETAVLPTPVPPPAVTQPEVQAPEIIVDHTNVSVDKDHVPVAEPGLADRVFALVSGRPQVEGSTAQFVVMRNAKPAHVGAVLEALRRAKATGATAKSEARDGTTEQISLSGLRPCVSVGRGVARRNSWSGPTNPYRGASSSTWPRALSAFRGLAQAQPSW
jgi:hypothetical protein